MARLFSALKGGLMRDLQQDGSTIRFRVILPEVACQEQPEYSFFYASLTNCKQFILQPFRNQDTVVKSLAQIERMGIEIEAAEAAGQRIKVFCNLQGIGNGGRLAIQCEQFQVWNEAFDAESPESLGALRGKA